MPPRSKIEQLPEGLRSALDRKLIGGGFAGYTELAAWLTEQGFSIGKSAVGVYGQALQQRLPAIKASTEAAKLIAEAAPDEADERSNAIISMTQTGIFNALLALQEATDQDEDSDPAERVALLGQAAKNIATLTRASVTRNKWADELKRKVQDAAAEVKKLGEQGGLSEEALALIDQRIMGIS